MFSNRVQTECSLEVGSEAKDLRSACTARGWKPSMLLAKYLLSVDFPHISQTCAILSPTSSPYPNKEPLTLLRWWWWGWILIVQIRSRKWSSYPLVHAQKCPFSDVDHHVMCSVSLECTPPYNWAPLISIQWENSWEWAVRLRSYLANCLAHADGMSKIQSPKARDMEGRTTQGVV